MLTGTLLPTAAAAAGQSVNTDIHIDDVVKLTLKYLPAGENREYYRTVLAALIPTESAPGSKPGTLNVRSLNPHPNGGMGTSQFVARTALTLLRRYGLEYDGPNAERYRALIKNTPVNPNGQRLLPQRQAGETQQQANRRFVQQFVFDPEFNAFLTARLISEHTTALRAAMGGRQPSVGVQKAAWVLGPAVAARVVRAAEQNPDAPMSDFLTPLEAKANPQLARQRAGEALTSFTRMTSNQRRAGEYRRASRRPPPEPTQRDLNPVLGMLSGDSVAAQVRGLYEAPTGARGPSSPARNMSVPPPSGMSVPSPSATLDTQRALNSPPASPPGPRQVPLLTPPAATPPAENPYGFLLRAPGARLPPQPLQADTTSQPPAQPLLNAGPQPSKPFVPSYEDGGLVIKQVEPIPQKTPGTPMPRKQIGDYDYSTAFVHNDAVGGGRQGQTALPPVQPFSPGTFTSTPPNPMSMGQPTFNAPTFTPGGGFSPRFGVGGVSGFVQSVLTGGGVPALFDINAPQLQRDMPGRFDNFGQMMQEPDQQDPRTQTIEFETGGMVGPGGANMDAVAGAPAPTQGPGLPLPQGGEEDFELMARQSMQQNPQAVAQIRELVMQAMQSGELTAEELQTVTQLAQTALRDPSLYPQLRAFAIQNGIGTEEDIPEEFDPGLLSVVIIAAESVNSQGGQQRGLKPMQSTDDVGGVLPQKSNSEDGVVPIKAHEGEFVLHAGAVRAVGLDRLRALNEKYDKDGNKKHKEKATV